MQNITCKIPGALIALLLLVINTAFAQEDPADLALADSLFQQQKYTESLETYESILKQQQQYSPRMLLKMGFIQEGLGNYSQSLYYLNLYYSLTSDKTVLKKMETLAKDNRLEGYEFTDWSWLMNVYKRYRQQIIMVVLGLTLLIFSLILYQKRRSQERPVVAGIFFVISLAVLFGLLNFLPDHSKGIIKNNPAYIRNAPSGASDVTEIIGSGHRVTVLGKEDVWVKIRWKEEVAYIKENGILLIES